MRTPNNTSTDLQRTVCMLVNGELNDCNLSVQHDCMVYRCYSRNPWLGTRIRWCHRISIYRRSFVVVVVQFFNRASLGTTCHHGPANWVSPNSMIIHYWIWLNCHHHDHLLLFIQWPRPSGALCHVFDRQLTFHSLNMSPPGRFRIRAIYCVDGAHVVAVPMLWIDDDPTNLIYKPSISSLTASPSAPSNQDRVPLPTWPPIIHWLSKRISLLNSVMPQA